MFFDFQDSDGTPLSRYRVFYAELLSFKVVRSATNATVMVVYNQADTWLASAALGVLSLMSSTNTVLTALGDVYRSVFGRLFEIVPPAAVMSLALMIYVVWSMIDRRRNIRDLGQDRNRIAVAVVVAVAFSWLLRNPFYLMDQALTSIPNLVVDFVGEGSTGSGHTDGSRAGVAGYLMDSVVRPVTQSLMYGRLLDGECVHEFSRAMSRGNAPACAPALAEAPSGALAAAITLGVFFFVLLMYGLALFAMYLYHATMAAWSWVSLLYYLGKSLFDAKAITVPGRKVMVAAGHTGAAAVVNIFAIVGPALVIAIVNELTDGDPTFSVILYTVFIVLLFFVSRQAVGGLLRKTGAVHGNQGSVINRVVAPRAMFGSEAYARQRETAANVAGLTSRVAAAASMFPGAAVLAAGAAAVETRLRGGSAHAEGEASAVPRLSEQDRETVDGAIDVIAVGTARQQTTHTVTWPPAPKPAAPSAGRTEVIAADSGPPEAGPASEASQQLDDQRRPDAEAGKQTPAPAASVDVSSPVVFGGLGPHRLEPTSAEGPQAPAAEQRGVSRDGQVLTETADDNARRVRERSAAAFGALGAGSGDAAEGEAAADEVIAPMVRSYSPSPSRVRESGVTSESGVVRTGRAAARDAAVAAAKRDRARYVLAASGNNTVPVAADDDPGLRVFMYNNGTRNVVDPAEGEYVMGSRI
ncbi:hypothetical protein ACNUDN_30280 [Mycobacterium sp. smrl_JER01]|uniref:hypothetical protein n=1 Tax=Mycobacterium sp. smrl_JER01 TaxID=3402633 RepID=UPI003AC12E4C